MAVYANRMRSIVMENYLYIFVNICFIEDYGTITEKKTFNQKRGQKGADCP